MTEPADCTDHSLSRDQALLMTAYHEAGHAVVAVHHDLPVTSLNLDQDTSDNGSWSVGGITYVTYYPDMAHECALQGAAGELAALRWLHDKNLASEASTAADADHDREEVIGLLAQDGIDVDWSRIRDLARAEVHGLWPQISAVAHAAVEKGRLTGVEIAELMQHGARGFREHHGTPETWTTADFETYGHLAEIDALPALRDDRPETVDCWFCSAPNPASVTICGFCSHHIADNPAA